MTDNADNEASQWLIVQIEDDEEHREAVCERLEGESIAGRPIELMSFEEFDDAKGILAAKRADLVILDVFKGEPTPDGLAAGLEVLASSKKSSTAPVILYTALPSHCEDEAGPFVRIVNKQDGTAGLWNAIHTFFDDRLPQLHRTIADRVDHVLSKYMWEFAWDNWETLNPLAKQADFLQMVLLRLTLELRSNEGMDEMLATYGIDGYAPAEDDSVPPAALYIKPPVMPHPMLGDIRRLTDGGPFLVVLQPSCDLALRPPKDGGDPKAKCEQVLCVEARPSGEDEAFKEATTNIQKANPKDKLMKKIVENKHGDFLHFLPKAWDIPDLVADFRRPVVVPFQEVNEAPVLATLAPPFAESMAARFRSYIGRIGTPDLDVESVLQRYRKDGDAS